nr:MAG TPA: hypothetical protein [Caudoviricetes sp.]
MSRCCHQFITKQTAFWRSVFVEGQSLFRQFCGHIHAIIDLRAGDFIRRTLFSSLCSDFRFCASPRGAQTRGSPGNFDKSAVLRGRCAPDILFSSSSGVGGSSARPAKPQRNASGWSAEYLRWMRGVLT